jgi:adenosyl cobinamide kinase/adenosyl cobinamide phosphate guanylyltransferase
VTHQSHLILGGARSGKSRYAVALGRSASARTGFVATARTSDGDMRDRIARHRAERPREWLTVEEPLDVAGTCRRLVPQLDLIVVDCLTVWVANLLDRGRDDAAILSDADELAAVLGERCVSIIVVSNEVGEGVHPPTEIGLRFRDLLGAVNQRIAAAADLVTLMVAGIPVPIKRAAPGPPWSERGDRPHEAP